MLWLNLDIGTKALAAFQQAMQVTQNNIANANTEGYTRQRAVMQATSPVKMAFGELGSGVEVSAIEQYRDRFVDQHLRQETNTLARWDARTKIFDNILAVVNEPSDQAFSSLVSDFNASWQDLTDESGSMLSRQNVYEKGKALVDGIKQMYQQFSDMRKSINQDIRDQVAKVNDLSKKIAAINYQISNQERDGIKANMLRDTRNAYIDQLSDIADARFTERTDGTLDVTLFGESIVQGSHSYDIQTVARDGDAQGTVDVVWKDTGEKVNIRDGRIKGLLEMRDEVIPDYMQKIDNLAKGFISSVNEQHRAGMGLDGSKGITGARDFEGTLTKDGSFTINGTKIDVFAGDNLSSVVSRINAQESAAGVHADIDTTGKRLVLTPSTLVDPKKNVKVDGDPDNVMLNLGIISNFFSGTGAADIGIDPNIAGDYSKIAASTTGAPGDNTNAQAIADLKSDFTMNNSTMTFTDYYDSMITDLGLQAEASTRMQENQSSVVDQLDNVRQQVSGVSLDEEMANIMKFQRAYEAAARLVTTVDQMLDTLINRMAT